MFNLKSKIRIYRQFNYSRKNCSEEFTEIRKVPKYTLEILRKSVNCNEVRDELFNSMNLEEDKKLTPQIIKDKLDNYIIGQDEVKKAVAIALRTRYRKRLCQQSSVEDLKSHNLMIIGKSGSGKTEIIRQTAKFCNSPFIKVEAVRYTEVGYHGDDVENIIINLFKKTKNEFKKNIKELMWGLKSVQKPFEDFVLGFLFGPKFEESDMYENTKTLLKNGMIDNLEIVTHNVETGKIDKFSINDLKAFYIHDTLEKVFEKLEIDEIVKKNIEDRGIVCIDEFDKIARDKSLSSQSRASDEGVQNNLLPLLDGTDVPISEGKKSNMTINTRNILFVALGAFTKVKPEDLITEIQGRFPNKVRVNPLTKSDFKQILLHSKNSVIDQAIKLIKIEGLNVEFTECSLDKICEIAANLNIKEEDVGARRLISIVDHILQDISFDAPEIYNENKIEGKYVKVIINREYVEHKCDKILKEDRNYKKYII